MKYLRDLCVLQGAERLGGERNRLEWKVSLFNSVDPFLSDVTIDSDSLPADGTSQSVINNIKMKFPHT